MKYKAYIDCIDKDYRSYTGTSTIMVNSWKEAEEYCKKETWTGEHYVISCLVNVETNEYCYTEQKFNDSYKSN